MVGAITELAEVMSSVFSWGKGEFRKQLRESLKFTNNSRTDSWVFYKMVSVELE